MTFKDINEFVKASIKFNEFTNNRNKIRVYIYGTGSNCCRIEAKTIAELIREFKKEYYGDLSMNTELYMENDYICFNVSWKESHINFDTGRFYEEEKIEKYHFFYDEER